RLHALIAELESILADRGKVKQIIKDEMTAILNRYADERRTDILSAEHEIILEDLIERHSCVITLTHAGYIKRQPADTYSAQNRGGKGIIGMSTKEEDYIEKVVAVNSHSYLMMFTNTGKVQMRKAYLIPEAGRTAKGQNIVNILELTEGEKITACISVDSFSDDQYLTMVTKQGVIKRTLLSEYEYQRKGGKIALNLDEGDELVFVVATHGECDLMIATAHGQTVRFSEANVRAMGRTARGVKGISLREGDYVAGVCVIEEGKDLLCITENGFGKRSPFDDFRLMKHRGGFGVTCYNLTEKSGILTGIAAVDDNDDIMMITDSGTIIRTPVAGVPSSSRSAGGVIVMRLGEDQKLVNFTITPHAEESEEELAEDGEGTDTQTVEVTDGTENATEAVENSAEQSEE
ncbi:MAG: DNA gyrase subunit A, partial [Clostridia bacterium]|nr:DNA gyrase subunit A [Clostridia bacterium]